MKIEFLHKEEFNTRLILIYSGWGANARIAKEIKRKGWDVAVVFDYDDLNINLSFLDNYYTVYLIAWSLGVYAAALTLPGDRITAAFAINGTLKPIDDNLGIPLVIYENTEKNLSDRNLKKFRLRMAVDRDEHEEMLTRLDSDFSESRIDNLRNQLQTIRQLCLTNHKVNELPWVRAYIGMHDRIFPADNQRLSWAHDPEVETAVLETRGHYIPLELITDSVISDTEKVSARFSKAASTYDTHAIAQYSAALKLTDGFAGLHPVLHPKILEIGCGTGLFTHEYARLVKPSEVDFVDITECGPFGIAPEERYIIADAEKWIEEQDRRWDAIVSASAIQWFADIPRFLRTCAEKLSHEGVLAISTFAPGNMEELDELRPSPLIYPRASMLRECLHDLFEESQVIEDSIKVEFKSAREVLMHLKHTGVGGSAPGTGKSMKDMSRLRSLTYKPIYILARNSKKSL
ncbi:MAG: DUF452 family protein [Muribaculaceae bacterium]|nr:DUF452 family protein [Muribaculaceae bacterium]